MSTTILGVAVTKGFLSVDDPVGKYLPELDEAHGRVKIRELLTQTAGTHVNVTREFQVAFNPNRGAVITVPDYLRVARNPEAGPFIPLH